MAFTKQFRVTRVAFNARGKETSLMEMPESNILPSSKDSPCQITLYTGTPSEFDLTPLDGVFKVMFERTWPEEKE